MPTKMPSATRLPAPFQLVRSISSRSLMTLQPKTKGVMPFLSPKSGTLPQCRCMCVGLPSLSGRLLLSQTAYLVARAWNRRGSEPRLRFALWIIASVARDVMSMSASARATHSCSPDGPMRTRTCSSVSTRLLRTSQSISGARSNLKTLTS